jgi:redox-sensitive bicupin YhaK (pirin superfamily)
MMKLLVVALFAVVLQLSPTLGFLVHLGGLHHFPSHSARLEQQPWQRHMVNTEPSWIEQQPEPGRVDTTLGRDADDDRRIRRIEKFSRLPVWPAWNGVLIWLVGRLLGQNMGAKLEDAIGGRVCPNFFEYTETTPFVMLVHHCHSFFALDPVRFLQRTFFPEGFPAHPHRGFITITYILQGGFTHRDSQGVKQSYGADQERYNGKHTQWLVTGKGLQHEEMFDIHGLWSRQELYQIWLNIPASKKFDQPNSILLGGDIDTPHVVVVDGSETIVLAGSYRGHEAAAPCQTDLDILHVMVQKGSSWSYQVPDRRYQTMFLYVRQGTLSVHGSKVNTHHTAFFEATGNIVEVRCHDGNADFLFFAAVPLREPCVASGSMVMSSAAEIQQAYLDYERGRFGRPWDHKVSDEEWKKSLTVD